VKGGRRGRGGEGRSRGKPTPLKDALRAWARKAGVARRLDQARAVEDWAERVGPQIAAVTRADSVTPDGLLRVQVASAAWATELSLMTPRILARLNEGREGKIRDIRWIAGPLDRP
jgi:predicted nucleic acid-binding Zn ribbon protein